ncbi:hypothetical protein GCM10027404_00990 [Arthrobacter tumbae]|uniref:hypothetical protein n=1 Tax=Arthrobacter tumbae TaxID=163874 RepID=UPI00195E284A|nr:hypothetical protein [Arthrobacter tumbae]MBM7780457.1 hypothetical protein [Arthrobacter tumbae]
MSTARKPKPPTAEELRAEIVAEVTAELERLAEVDRETREEISRLDAEHDVKLDRWQVDCAEARAEYRPEPPRPERESIAQLQQLLHRLHEARTAAHDRAEKMLGHQKLMIESRWQEARETLTRRTEEALKPLEALAVEVGDWRRLLSDARLADERVKGVRLLNGEASRMRSSIGVPDLQALAAGTDPLAPAPLPPTSARDKEAADRGEREAFRRSQDKSQGGTWRQT